MDFGIILRNEIKANSLPEMGELQYLTDTDEYSTNENGKIIYRKNSMNLSRYAIFPGVDIPIDGLNGDWFIDKDSHSSGEYIEYFNINGWKERPQGFTENYLLLNFEPKVNWPTDFITIDGRVKLSGTAYEAKISNNYENLTQNSLVVKKYIDIELPKYITPGTIKKDGSVKMLPTYEPLLEGDVLDVKSLSSGDMYFIPPTTMPMKFGAIWNDNGTPKIVGIGSLGRLETALSAYNLSGSQFGRFVDMSSTRMLIGAPFYSNPATSRYDGAGFLFNKQTGTLVRALIPTPINNWAQTGWSVSLSEDRATLASNYDNTVYVYDNDGILLKTILSPDGNVLFGEDVSVFGNRIVIGSNHNTLGQAYIYDKNGEYISTISRRVGSVWFGGRVAVSSNRIVVTDPGIISTGVNGLAHIYDLDGNFLLTISPPIVQAVSAATAYGYGLAVSDTQIFIGYPGFNHGDGFRTGKVHVYSLDGTLTQTIETPVGVTQTEFGRSLDISEDGKKLAIGSWNGYVAGVKTGCNWVYDTTSHSLVQISLNTWVVNDAFGTDVAIDGGILLSGSYNKNYDGSGEDGSVIKFLAY